MSIDQDFIEKYQEEEERAFNRYKSASERIGPLRAPVFDLIPSNPWSQFAFSGTTIFILKPCSQTEFKESYKISPKEIPDLIRFARETKKIQFVLNRDPKDFQRFDYLEPILKEFKPPVLYGSYGKVPDDFVEIYKQCSIEVHTLISTSSYWKRKNIENKAAIDYLISIYTSTRLNGFNEIADFFIDNFLIYPDCAANYLVLADKFTIESSRNPLNVNFSCTIDDLYKATILGFQSRQSLKKISFPEVGSFLMQKCTHYPDSLTACNFLIHEYEDKDLYEVFSVLNDAVSQRNDASILHRTKEMGEILDNIWNDTKIRDDSIVYKWGINLALGAIGYAIGNSQGLIGAVLGKTIDDTSSKFIENYSELIAKKLASPRMAAIYNFKRKYQNKLIL